MGDGSSRPLSRELLAGNPAAVAPQLLNALLVRGSAVARIVEVEAYGGAEDPASHAARGRTTRNRSMFGPPGTLYVYFIYGMHWCANVVCGAEGEGGAVLLRAGRPEAGIAEMRERRPGVRREVDLCNGPAKLCAALGIDGSFDGSDLTAGEVRLLQDGQTPPATPARGPRIGISVGVELPWRWCVPDEPHLSRRF